MDNHLQPYLGPRALVSLSWLSQPLLSLILLFVALAFLLNSLGGLVTDAKASLAAGCSAVEGAGNVLVSLPHYSAQGINELNAKSVKAVTSGAATVLDMTLEAVLAIVLFMIDLYRSLFLCLMNLAVHGGLTLLIDATEEFDSFVTETFQDVRSGVQGAVGVVNEGLEKTLGLIDRLPGVDIDIPQLSPNLDFLNNVTLPSGVLQGLTSLNDSIPTLDELRASLNSVISAPVNSLRSTIATNLGNATIDVELLPVPAKETVELCTGLDTSFLDDVGHALAKVIKVSMGLIVLAAVSFMFACALFERWQYRSFLEGVARARESWLLDLGHSPVAPTATVDARDALSDRNLLSFLSASNHPTLSLVLSRIANRLRLLPSTRSSLYWFGAYILHPAALAFLALGVVGLIMVQVQLAILQGPVKDMAQSRASDGAGDFSTSVMGSINSQMAATSSEWAVGSNKVITAMQTTINDDLFTWVNTTTEAMNSTINGFYDGITDTLTDVFNGTVLENPVLQLVYCLIGSKVDAISSALTWVHAHAHISLPMVSPDALLLSKSQTDDLTSDLTNPNSSVSTTSLVDKMINSYAKSLEQQRMGFFICLGIWGIVVVMALVGLFWELRGAELWASWRGQPSPGSLGGHYRSASSEKAELRPFHLRADSLVKPTTDDAAYSAFPSAPLAPPPPRRSSLAPSAASWGSLIDFFRPTPAETKSTALEMTESAADRRSPFVLKVPSIPGFRPHFPSWEPATSPLGRQPKRYSDEVDLRSGAQVDRAYPFGSGKTFKSKLAVQGAAGRLAGTVRGVKSRRNGSKRRSPSSQQHTAVASQWTGVAEDVSDDENWPTLAPPQPFRHPLQQPLSPPPQPAQHPHLATSFPVSSYPPLKPDNISQPRRQISTYRPSSRPRPAPVNPFATPFDGPDEL